MNLQGTGSVIHMDHALAAITGDIIVQLSVGTAPGLTNDPEFSPEWWVQDPGPQGASTLTVSQVRTDDKNHHGCACVQMLPMVEQVGHFEGGVLLMLTDTFGSRLIQMLPESVIQGMYPKGISNMMLGKVYMGYLHLRQFGTFTDS